MVSDSLVCVGKSSLEGSDVLCVFTNLSVKDGNLAGELGISSLKGADAGLESINVLAVIALQRIECAAEHNYLALQGSNRLLGRQLIYLYIDVVDV